MNRRTLLRTAAASLVVTACGSTGATAGGTATRSPTPSPAPAATKATVELAKGGSFAFTLRVDKAPNTVANFAKKSRAGDYDGTTFHRVVAGFVAQGGDPLSKTLSAGDPRLGTGGGNQPTELSDLPFDKGAVVLDAVLDAGRAVLAAELLGVAEESFERTLGYLRDREQFGVKIGTFQALQHRAAHLFCEIELVRSVVLRTLQALDAQEPTASNLVCLAKGKASDIARIATNEAVQMHGGIGMTDEFDIGFFMKRARAAGETFGDYYYHADRFAQLAGY